MDEREELLKRDREKEKRREQRRLEREQELRKQMVMGAGVLAALVVVLIKEGKGGGCKRKSRTGKTGP